VGFDRAQGVTFHCRGPRMRCVSIAKLSRDGKDVKPLPIQESAHGYCCMICIPPSPRHRYYTMIVRVALIAWGKTCTLTFVDNPADSLRSSWPRPPRKAEQQSDNRRHWKLCGARVPFRNVLTKSRYSITYFWFPKKSIHKPPSPLKL
jgi:hypothetical protein